MPNLVTLCILVASTAAATALGFWLSDIIDRKIKPHVMRYFTQSFRIDKRDDAS